MFHNIIVILARSIGQVARIEYDYGDGRPLSIVVTLWTGVDVPTVRYDLLVGLDNFHVDFVKVAPILRVRVVGSITIVVRIGGQDDVTGRCRASARIRLAIRYC